VGKNNNNNGIVYSTDPDFIKEGAGEAVEQTPLATQQKLKIFTDSKHRAGKVVTLVQGFVGRAEDLEKLAKTLKNFCGSGGSFKEGEIIIQGKHTEKIIKKLTELKYQIK